ncbi:MAG TPA: hypothetical protein PKW82_10675 [Spirochaetales bacterium]|nr:hypothetical protein [Spirochaetales bacterium]
MSGKEVSGAKAPRRLAPRRAVALAVVAAAYLGAGAWAMLTGKSHTILVDNKPVAGLEAFRLVEVTIGRQEPLELGRGERDKFAVQGQSHRVRIDLMNGSDPVTATLRLPYDAKMVLVSLPKLVAGIEPAWEPFETGQDAPPPVVDELPEELFGAAIDLPPPEAAGD